MWPYLDAGHLGHSLGGGGSDDGMNLTLTWSDLAQSWPHALARQMTKPRVSGMN